MKLKENKKFRHLKRIIEEVAVKVEDDWDFTIIITGKKRKGKSTLMFTFNKYLAELLDTRVWFCYSYGLNVEEDYEAEAIERRRKELRLEDTEIYPARMQYALKHAGHGDVIFADESINFLYSGDWNSPAAKDFIRRHDRYGYKDLTYTLLMPAYNNFVKGFREDRIDAHIWIKRRGLAWFYPMKDTPFGVIRGKHEPVAFPKLDPQEEKQYTKIKEYMIDDVDIQEDIETPVEVKQKINKRLKQWVLDHPSELGRMKTTKVRSMILGVGDGTISRWDNL